MKTVKSRKLAQTTQGVVTPNFLGVLPLDSRILAAIIQLYENKDYLDATKVGEILKKFEGDRLLRLDNPEKPTFIRFGDKKSMVAVWSFDNLEDKERRNPENYLIIISEEVKEGKGVYRPSYILRGGIMNVAIFGYMGCCPGSMQCHVTYVQGNGEGLQKGLVTRSGFKHEGERFWMEPDKVNTILITKDQPHIMPLISHILQHVKGEGHDCHGFPKPLNDSLAEGEKVSDYLTLSKL